MHMMNLYVLHVYWEPVPRNDLTIPSLKLSELSADTAGQQLVTESEKIKVNEYVT